MQVREAAASGARELGGAALAVLVVWCVSSAGPPKSKVATSLAYTKNRLHPDLPSSSYQLYQEF